MSKRTVEDLYKIEQIGLEELSSIPDDKLEEHFDFLKSYSICLKREKKRRDKVRFTNELKETFASRYEGDIEKIQNWIKEWSDASFEEDPENNVGQYSTCGWTFKISLSEDVTLVNSYERENYSNSDWSKQVLKIITDKESLLCNERSFPCNEETFQSLLKDKTGLSWEEFCDVIHTIFISMEENLHQSFSIDFEFEENHILERS
jgi:hypothetical protein